MKNERQENIDQVWLRLCDVIKENGWAVMGILGTQTQPSYSYTIGLSAKSLPEVMMIGVAPDIARIMLNSCARLLLDGRVKPTQHAPVQEVANMPLAFRLDEDAGLAHLSRGARRWSESNGHAMSVLQLVFPDAKGHLPWDGQCDPKMVALQDPSALLHVEDIDQNASLATTKLFKKLRNKP